ncbi:MAG: UDP-N-acetylglucosamine 2-epimerase [Candidatus Margulisbacteria bacterium]|nr:UDP-N-acetylglucosamine 2-epimerase [Candidatus Margulisiibacteriota bacterium]MBU1022061.1 UDP-N-acetylglucosamine 2-epimerase [Candidatus Margulisiibacteriota bacterium]MBU1729656.1 UDP-N-acetylglucosamine 2-epimerase [Candidatus Margulisiibacteriota bacterium]MBU1954976.1 UDP-N-acetylglucosamine 2-epimerase [Candidatus Margulisiibacteriota bacterium]
MTKKILYLFSDTGGGHRTAATALIKAVNHTSNSKYQQEMIDVFVQGSGILSFITGLYAPIIKYIPWFWGAMYYYLDDPKKLQLLELVSKPFILRNLKKMIKDFDPDLIVSVHPLVNHLTVRALKELKRKTPFVVVITDPVTLHRAWVADDVEMYYVATEEAAHNCVKYGLDKKKIKVLGIPVDPKFALKDFQKADARVDDRLEPDYFTVMLMGGGEGGGGMYKIVKAIEQSDLNIQLVVIAGRNKVLENKLKAEAKNLKFPMKVFGFTSRIAELMSESNLLITKAGPGTIAEALSMDLPLILTSWLPGQEEGNVEFVVKDGLGRVCPNPDEIVEVIRSLKDTPEYKKMKENIKKVSKPHAAFDIAKEIIRHL